MKGQGWNVLAEHKLFSRRPVMQIVQGYLQRSTCQELKVNQPLNCGKSDLHSD